MKRFTWVILLGLTVALSVDLSYAEKGGGGKGGGGGGGKGGGGNAQGGGGPAPAVAVAEPASAAAGKAVVVPALAAGKVVEPVSAVAQCARRRSAGLRQRGHAARMASAAVAA